LVTLSLSATVKRIVGLVIRTNRKLYNADLPVFNVYLTNERTNEVYLPMNGVNNDWLPVEAEAQTHVWQECIGSHVIR